MAPPTVVDPWLAGRRFGIVIDAGSSGSRLQIYSWRDARVVQAEDGPDAFGTLPKVEKGTQDGDDWISKVEPGISSFGENPDGVGPYLAPLLAHARANIPPSMEKETPIYLLATAGMRLLPEQQQQSVLRATCDFLRFHSDFRLDNPSSAGPCGSSIRIISGEEEGLFGWIAVNYLMDQFTRTASQQATYGFLDMGGASTQIAFEPGAKEQQDARGLKEVRLRLIGGDVITHQVFVTTWLGYGTNQAREKYVAKTIVDQESGMQGEEEVKSDIILDPCLPKGLELLETPVHVVPADTHSKKAHTLRGTGSFEKCLKQVGPMLNKDAPCPDVPCLFNGVHVPHIDFSVSHFIGVSEYWYSSEHVFGLGGPFDFVEYERAASEFCSRDWSDITRQHEESKAAGTLGGDGEVEEDGQIVQTGKWGDKVEISRLQMQCFKSAWIVNVLHDGIGMPRLVDPGGNMTADAEDDVEKHALQHGLGRPILQSMDTVNDTAISWTLGKMVLEASSEVPPLSADKDPILDPVVGSGKSQDSEPAQSSGPGHKDEAGVPSRFPFRAGHYPPVLTWFNLLLFVALFLAVIILAYRLRRIVWTGLCRSLRRTLKKDDIESRVRMDIENGQRYNGGRRWFSSMRSQLSRTLVNIQSRTRVVSAPFGPTLRHTHSGLSDNRFDKSRSFSSPSLRYQNGSSNSYQSLYTAASTQSPRPSSPTGAYGSLGQANGHANQSFYSLPRSRNSSQLNLTTLVPRGPVSRAGSSGQQTPTSFSFHDGDLS